MPSLILLLEGCERHSYPLGKATLMVGRDSASDLQLPSTSISANHASIVFQDGEFVLRDNGSPNGSFVNGEKVTRRVLAHHDIIRFGEYTFLVDLEDDEGLDAEEKKREESSPEELEEEKRGEYVPAAKSKRKYSEVVQVDKPKSTAKLGPLPGLELRLTKPVPYTMVTAVKRSPPQPEVAQPAKNDMLIKVVGIVAVVLIAIFITLKVLPFAAREAIVNADGFKGLPLSSVVSGMLVSQETVPYSLSLKEGNPPFGVKMTVPRSSRLKGTLRFLQKTSAAMTIKISVRRIGDPGEVIFDQSIEVPTDTDSLPLFSLLVKPGVYAFEGYCQQEAFLGQTSATFDLTSYQ